MEAVGARLRYAIVIAVIALLGQPVRVEGQSCALPDSVRALVPNAPPPAGAYSMVWRGETSFGASLGVGHLHYSGGGAASAGPPGENDWLGRVELPLSESPDAEPWGWIVGGWVVRDGSTPEPLRSGTLVETGYEEPSFIVLEENADGWLRIRHASTDTEIQTSWTPTCALQSSPAALRFTRWNDWFLSGETSPLFFRSEMPQTLRSGASRESSPLAEISGDYILEPLEIRGEWMRVALKQPSDYCLVDVESTSTEGWVRWYSEETGSRVWYFTRGC